jgi:tRNA1(Val) A37 N6-methylase TrmN6
MSVDDVTENAFLGGRLRIRQPRKGYRAGVDPVILAASVPVKSGQSVLELGCGVGVASLCLAARVPELRITGIELQPEYAALARENADLNEVAFEVVEADLAALPAEVKQRHFDHVIANPPYFDRAASSRAGDAGREVAMGEDTPLATWVEAAAKRLAPKGYATFIHRVERLPDLLAEVSRHLGSIELLPLQPRVGREAQLVLLRARKGGKAAFRIHAPVLMHEGARHERDGESYTPLLRSVLRRGAELPFSAVLETDSGSD